MAIGSRPTASSPSAAPSAPEAVNATLPAEPRSEPLLWLQLLGLGALPLEARLVLRVVAGSDPGPWPWLERGLAWALGVLGPALLLWSRPADVFSLLLLSTPLRGRRELQRRLSGLQQGLGQRLAVVLGAAALLPLLVWLDRWSVLARDLALLPEAPRLVALLLSSAVLALMLWQWQQLLQAAWLLLRTAGAVAAATALTAEEIASRRLCLGLPLLLPDPLRFASAAKRKPKVPKAPELVPKAAELKTKPRADVGTTTDAAGGEPREGRDSGGRATGVAAALSPQAAAISDGPAPLDAQPEAAAAPAPGLATTLETAESGEPQAMAATPALDPEETLAPVASLELATADEAAPSPDSPTPAAQISEADSEPAQADIPPAAAAEDQQPMEPSQDDAAPHPADDNLPEMEAVEADASAPEPPSQEIDPDLEPERWAAEPAGSPPTDAEPAQADAARTAAPGQGAKSGEASV